MGGVWLMIDDGFPASLFTGFGRGLTRLRLAAGPGIVIVKYYVTKGWGLLKAGDQCLAASLDGSRPGPFEWPNWYHAELLEGKCLRSWILAPWVVSMAMAHADATLLSYEVPGTQVTAVWLVREREHMPDQ